MSDGILTFHGFLILNSKFPAVTGIAEQIQSFIQLRTCGFLVSGTMSNFCVISKFPFAILDECLEERPSNWSLRLIFSYIGTLGWWECYKAMESYCKPKSWSDKTTSSTPHKPVLASIPGLCHVGHVTAPWRSLIDLTRASAKLSPISFSLIHWKKAQEHYDTTLENC